MRFIACVITVLFLFVGVKLCLTGDRTYEDSQRFMLPQEVSYDSIAKDPPLEGWYQISGCSVDITEAAYRSAQVINEPTNRPTQQDAALLAQTTEVYVPVHTQGGIAQKAAVILLSRDADLVSAVKALAKVADSSVHSTAPRIIKGMVRLPAELPDRIRRLLGNSITTQSIIIEEYAAPSAPRAIQTMATGAALMLATALMWLLIWRRDRQALPIPDQYLLDSEFEYDDAVDEPAPKNTVIN